ADDLAALSSDMVIDDDGIGKPGPVEVAIDLGPDNDLTGAVGNVDDLEGHARREDLAVAPVLDGGTTPELAACIVDNGLVTEEGDERGSIMVVDRPHVSRCGWLPCLWFSGWSAPVDGSLRWSVHACLLRLRKTGAPLLRHLHRHCQRPTVTTRRRDS